jgi:hypothetical protein
MKRRRFVVPLLCAAAIAAGAVVIVAAVLLRRDTTLEFQLVDSVSGKWVWDATMKIQGREALAYYQTDAGPSWYTFTHLAPGASALDLSAPGYTPVSVPVALRRGANRIERPIVMTGLEIPGLTRFVLFESLDNSDIVVQLRPVGQDGKAVQNHPCLAVWVGARVSVETVGGLPARDSVDSGAARGQELFRGEVPWTWDPAPEAVFRYSARIAGAVMKADPSPLRVIDYLVVVPDPRAITKPELDSLMQRIWGLDEATRAAALQAEKGRLRFFTDTSWNVKARQE